LTYCRENKLTGAYTHINTNRHTQTRTDILYYTHTLAPNIKLVCVCDTARGGDRKRQTESERERKRERARQGEKGIERAGERGRGGEQREGREGGGEHTDREYAHV